jgi:hypothetical protein
VKEYGATRTFLSCYHVSVVLTGLSGSVLAEVVSDDDEHPVNFGFLRGFVPFKGRTKVFG